MKKYIFLILFILFSVNSQILSGDKKNQRYNSNQLNWNKTIDYPQTILPWEKSSLNLLDESDFLFAKKNKNYKINSLRRTVTVNGLTYPEISNYVPNAYVSDSGKRFSLSSRGISKTRHCKGNNFSSKCIDGILDIDFKIFNTEEISLNTIFTIQSLTDRGKTEILDGTSMGFKFAKYINPSWSIAFGGENVIHFDDPIDLGKNFYFVASTHYPLSSTKDNPSIIFLNAGIGSDFYGYKGNGFLAKTTCFGGQTLTGEGTHNCQWGPVGSISLAINDRLSINNEWFGYGYGSGLSIKPLKYKPIIISLYATDYIKGIPTYASQGCENNICTTRFYGSVSLSF